MPTTVTVLYKESSKFDMDYYKSTHMPLVQKNWAPYGLKSWKVIQFPPGAPFCVQATLEWDNVEDLKKAQASDAAKEIMNDIPNFATPADPILIGGEVVFTSSS